LLKVIQARLFGCGCKNAIIDEETVGLMAGGHRFGESLMFCVKPACPILIRKTLPFILTLPEYSAVLNQCHTALSSGQKQQGPFGASD